MHCTIQQSLDLLPVAEEELGGVLEEEEFNIGLDLAYPLADANDDEDNGLLVVLYGFHDLVVVVVVVLAIFKPPVLLLPDIDGDVAAEPRLEKGPV